MLRAARFDRIRLEVHSDPVTVVEHVMMKPGGAANYAVSRSGMLVYVPGDAGETPMRSLVWVDRKGNEEPVDAPLRGYGPPRISPDGTRAVMGIANQGNTDLWILHFEQRTVTRLTFDPSMDGMPLWTPDGMRIIFMSTTTGVPNLYTKAVDGSGTADRLTTSDYPQWPTSISSDGTRLFGFELGPKNTRQVFVIHLTNPANPPTLDSASNLRAALPVQTLFQGNFPELSPDGRYLAYQSHESGLIDVHVRPFPDVDRGRWQITTRGGTRPAWARSGRELFYLDESGALTAVPVETSGPTLTVGSATKVFDTRYAEPNPARHYDVSPDGQRFLVIKDNAANADTTPANIVVVQQWLEELKTRVP
jgi:Tol biopolymer transport system component